MLQGRIFLFCLIFILTLNKNYVIIVLRKERIILDIDNQYVTSDRSNIINEYQTILAYPYFVFKNVIETGYNIFSQELLDIHNMYSIYQKGARFLTEGNCGDYIPSHLRYRQIKVLIDKEARFMFSQSPDVYIKASNISDEGDRKKANELQVVANKVIEKTNFFNYLLTSAKDCFIGKRVACLIDFHERTGIGIRFYDSLHFYSETESSTDILIRFVCFEQTNQSKSKTERRYIVNDYQQDNGTVTFNSALYDGMGNIIEVLFPDSVLEGFEEIPAVVICNQGTLSQNKTGVSDVESLMFYEQLSSQLSNADVDSVRKGMNPVRYTVDMAGNTTNNLSSSAGSYWDLQHNQNINDPRPMVGTLAPELNHTEPLKYTIGKIRQMMFETLEVPDISTETMQGIITSGKTLNALYYPLQVRCDEKLKTWKPAIEKIIDCVLKFCFINTTLVQQIYKVGEFEELDYNIVISENYALVDDENEEKEIDIQEVNSLVRSKLSYIKKWRKSEFETDEEIEAELLQIAKEQSMMNNLSGLVSEQTEQDRTEAQVDDNIEKLKTDETLEG